MEKKTIALIVGGCSSEHEVSLVSGGNIATALDKEKWNLFLIGIKKDGSWVHIESLDSLKDGSWRDSKIQAFLSPDSTEKAVYLFDEEDKFLKKVKIDVCWPALHGKNGEDGTIQGLLELAQIPYVGCGVLASAVSMDKLYTKIIVNPTGVRQANYKAVFKNDMDRVEELANDIFKELGSPVFVKPSRAGSSCGVSKASSQSELIQALKTAFQYDSKVLVEEFIDGRELECAVMGDKEHGIYAAGVGEIKAAAEFYDYDAKYNNPDSMTITDPVLPEGKKEEIMESAKKIYAALDCSGLSRVDFFLSKQNNEVIFNEINTMPGFTAISMYPMLWRAAGMSDTEIVEKLVELGLERI